MAKPEVGCSKASCPVRKKAARASVDSGREVVNHTRVTGTSAMVHSARTMMATVYSFKCRPSAAGCTVQKVSSRASPPSSAKRNVCPGARIAL